MTGHPATRDLYFIRHAPVHKAAGHVPPCNPPILEADYHLQPVTAMLPRDAAWLVSPLQRARQTADLLAPALDPASRAELPELSEMEFGDWAGRPVAEVWDEISTGPLQNRVSAWMESLAFDTAPLVIIAHSGVMRAAMAHALAMPTDHAVGIPIAHFGVLHLRQMDPARAMAAGGHWLFAGLTDPKAVPASAS